MHPLIEELLSQRPILLDGAWGTRLYALGLAPGSCPDLWNLEHPDRVRSVASEYVEAGSDIILTNTFGANPFVLESHGASDRVTEINRAGAAISKEAAGQKARVFGSIGPSGKMLVMEEVTEEELEKGFRLQAEALATGGADGIVVETMADLDEAVIAIKAARTTGLPVVGCMVYDSGADKDRTMMGITPEQQAQAFAEAGADVIGSNCGQGIAGFVQIAQRLKAASSLPLWIKANAGLPERIDGKLVYQTGPEDFAESAAGVVAAGAAFIGGCCGTGPAFIRKVREVLKGG